MSNLGEDGPNCSVNLRRIHRATLLQGVHEGGLVHPQRRRQHGLVERDVQTCQQRAGSGLDAGGAPEIVGPAGQDPTALVGDHQPGGRRTRLGERDRAGDIHGASGTGERGRRIRRLIGPRLGRRLKGHPGSVLPLPQTACHALVPEPQESMPGYPCTFLESMF